MARKKYTVSVKDMRPVYSWINNKFKNASSFPSEHFDVIIQAKKDFELTGLCSFKANEEEERIEYANKLNTWCEKYLNNKQWTTLKTTIRKNRLRSSRIDKRTVTLDSNAHYILQDISKMEDITLSEVIVRHLKKVQYSLMDVEEEKRYQEKKKKWDAERDDRTTDMFKP